VRVLLAALLLLLFVQDAGRLDKLAAAVGFLRLIKRVHL